MTEPDPATDSMRDLDRLVLASHDSRCPNGRDCMTCALPPRHPLPMVRTDRRVEEDEERRRDRSKVTMSPYARREAEGPDAATRTRAADHRLRRETPSRSPLLIRVAVVVLLVLIGVAVTAYAMSWGTSTPPAPIQPRTTVLSAPEPTSTPAVPGTTRVTVNSPGNYTTCIGLEQGQLPITAVRNAYGQSSTNAEAIDYLTRGVHDIQTLCPRFRDEADQLQDMINVLETDNAMNGDN